MVLAIAVVSMVACQRPTGEEVEIEFKSRHYTVEVGSTVKTAIKVTPEGTDLSGLTFSSSDESKATVDSEGVVTGVATGRVTITAKLGEKSAECTVTVKAAPTIALNPTQLDLYVNASHYLMVTADPADTDLGAVKFQSENPEVATVDVLGGVKAVAAGTTKIIATLGQSTAECTVRVIAPSVEPATRNAVLIEEFTGQDCTYCPGGATAIHNAMAEMPAGKTILVAHHVGHYEDDFTMVFSRPLVYFYGGEGTYTPACIMDRRRMSGDKNRPTPVTSPYAVNKNTLQKALDEPTYVALNMSATLDGDSITVTVTGNLLVENPNARLTVYLTQDNIIARQSGGGSSYNHPNMVRAMLSANAWGDAFESPQGAFTKVYGYKIPAKISGVKNKSFPVVMNDLYVVAFVSDNRALSLENINSMQVHNAAIVKVTQ